MESNPSANQDTPVLPGSHWRAALCRAGAARRSAGHSALDAAAARERPKVLFIDGTWERRPGLYQEIALGIK